MAARLHWDACSTCGARATRATVTADERGQANYNDRTYALRGLDRGTGRLVCGRLGHHLATV